MCVCVHVCMYMHMYMYVCVYVCITVLQYLIDTTVRLNLGNALLILICYALKFLLRYYYFFLCLLLLNALG